MGFFSSSRKQFKIPKEDLAKLAELTKLNYIIIHCSDSLVPAHDNPKVVDKWHRARGFTCIGYHKFVSRDGTEWKCRPLDKKGSHCRAKGRNNDSIGICMHGARGDFTKAQYKTVQKIIYRIQKKYGKLIIKGHRDFDKGKECPTIEVKDKFNV